MVLFAHHRRRRRRHHHHHHHLLCCAWKVSSESRKEVKSCPHLRASLNLMMHAKT